MPVRPLPTKHRVASIKELAKFQNLEQAWVKVRASALHSESAEIRGEAQEFSSNATSRLKSLQSRLSRGSFVFPPARGVLIRKAGSTKKRPIVVAPIESRVVQRAILELVQESPKVYSELTAGFNFGGVPGRGFGVPGAIAKAVKCAQSGGFFVRTDIKGFFTQIPRTRVVEDLCESIDGDEAFLAYFKSAVLTEIRDIHQYGTDAQLFPIYDTGVAQGSSLSPLLCNYLLRDFDREFNSRGITCVRYIDDFIMFGREKTRTQKAFQRAISQLEALGLSAYNPFDSADSRKAEAGDASKGFDFLGCHILPNRVRPTAEKVESLKTKIKSVFSECLKSTRTPGLAINSPDFSHTYAGATLLASQIVRAWGNTYSFCNDDQLMNSIDIELGKLFNKFQTAFVARTAALNEPDRRRARGFYCLIDCNKNDEAESARTIARSAVLRKPS